MQAIKTVEKSRCYHVIGVYICRLTQYFISKIFRSSILSSLSADGDAIMSLPCFTREIVYFRRDLLLLAVKISMLGYLPSLGNLSRVLFLKSIDSQIKLVGIM
jgi:hypothetical protein